MAPVTTYFPGNTLFAKIPEFLDGRMTGGFRCLFNQEPLLARVHRPPPFTPRSPRSGPSGLKQDIEEFSDSAKNTFLKKAAPQIVVLVNNPDHPTLFLTLTYGKNVLKNKTIANCKTDLDTFLKALRRVAPLGCWIWVLEFQKRGAPHYHIVWSHKGVTREEAIKATEGVWLRITGEDGSSTESRKRYSCDYGEGVGEQTIQYLTTELTKSEQKKCPKGHKPGRYWGRGPHKNLPMPISNFEYLDSETTLSREREIDEIIRPNPGTRPLELSSGEVVEASFIPSHKIGSAAKYLVSGDPFDKESLARNVFNSRSRAAEKRRKSAREKKVKKENNEIEKMILEKSQKAQKEKEDRRKPEPLSVAKGWPPPQGVPISQKLGSQLPI